MKYRRGFAACLLGVLACCSPAAPPCETCHQLAPLGEDLRLAAASLQEVADSTRVLLASLREVPTRMPLPSLVDAEPGPPSALHDPPDSPPDRQPFPGHAAEWTEQGWAAVLDRGIATRLVEHGLTPYDPGVAPLVREAGRQLRSARADLNLGLRQCRETYESRPADTGEELHDKMLGSHREQRRLNEHHAARVAEALDSLDVALEELTSRSAQDS